MNRDRRGRFIRINNIISFIGSFVEGTWDHMKKTIVTVWVITFMVGLGHVNELLPKHAPQVVHASTVTTTVKAAKANDIGVFNAKLSAFKVLLVNDELKDPQTTFDCKKKLEESVNKRINILTSTSY